VSHYLVPLAVNYPAIDALSLDSTGQVTLFSDDVDGEAPMVMDGLLKI
jgi:hypothetical protein